ncbi:MAG: UDP-N-acetylmuramoyl-tripeptide--D-alanyl-D-alanine ligase [Acetobacteraceae bacterium]|nr:UDP-N-acetylmuramoyl-tripeptide--D-alanyl-D-alanine ligase [Acetobacteraceae bacterium]MSP29380.1 UDP-N-acetylmuramoyl-tripeptide--D-alanyl-D-alanine ligase [Acetobacteraceae bacterium]
MSALWNPEELIDATGGEMPRLFAATGLCIDTRQIKPGDLFIALIGENRDGHGFALEAMARGAAGVMIHQHIVGLSRTAPVLLVDDTLAALNRLAAFARQRFAGKLVAITGSVGKTTTKEMLRAILGAQGKTHAAEASFNNHWGVPLTLARLPEDSAWCVIEIGMNHAGEISPLAKLARPHVALITNVEKTHFGHLGSIEAIAEEKSSIVHGLEPGGPIVLPADSALLSHLRVATIGHPAITFGVARDADTRLTDVITEADATTLTADIGGIEVSTRLAAPGRHMALNALAALTAATALGADPVLGAPALTGFAPISGRGARRSIAVKGGAALLLDESYNASVASMRAAFAVLRLQPGRRRIAVLGDMLELGAAGPEEHLALAADLAVSADLVFTCGPLMGLLADALPAPQRGAHTSESASLALTVARAVGPGDVVLVKGSHGSRMQRIIAALAAAEASPSGLEKS